MIGRAALRRGGGRGRSRAAALAAAVLALSLVAAPRAQAYVRYKTKSGVGFLWAQTCVPIFAYPASMKDVNGNMEMKTADIMHASSAAGATWGAASTSADGPACTYLRLVVTEHDEATPKASLDYTNALVFRTTSWCAPNDPPGMCSYAAEALAITSVYVNKQNGRIIDGDIEVNAKNFIWTDLDLDPAGRGKQDLQNALTHEMGHLIGLDHTCFSAGTKGPVPVDDTGQEIPDCESASAEVQATTMFASAIPGDIAKRTLAPDDVKAVCDIYPPAEDPQFCPEKDEPPPQQGCAMVPGSRWGEGLGGALAALGVLAFAARRRRGPPS